MFTRTLRRRATSGTRESIRSAGRIPVRGPRSGTLSDRDAGIMIDGSFVFGFDCDGPDVFDRTTVPSDAVRQAARIFRENTNSSMDFYYYKCNMSCVTSVIGEERPMQQAPRISDSEWEVMRALWTESPLTANRIVEKLTATTPWKATTIRTLINRLVEKKAIGYEKKGREHHYSPLASESECVQAESQSFLERVYRGALNPILAAFMENEKLSPEDIKQLKRILEKNREDP